MERREVIFKNLEVEFIFNESNQILQLMCMNHQIYYLRLSLGLHKFKE